jgi:hypothetical protein
MLSLDWLEKLFGVLLPPASREHVLGDLHEKCKSRREYLIDAISVLGPVIVGRIRRTTDFQVFLMETVVVYLSFSAAALWLGQEAFLYDHAGFARLAIPTTVSAIGLLMCNAYADPEKQSFFVKPILQSAGSISLAFFGQAVIFDTRPSFVVPFGIMLYGSCTSLVLASTLRILFPPILSNRSKRALLHEPHLSQRPGIIASRATFEEIRQRISEVPFPLRFKTAATCAAVLVVAALLALSIRGGVFKPQFAVFAIVALLAIYQIRTRK